MFNAMREEVKVKLKKRKVHLTKDERRLWRSVQTTEEKGQNKRFHHFLNSSLANDASSYLFAFDRKGGGRVELTLRKFMRG